MTARQALGLALIALPAPLLPCPVLWAIGIFCVSAVPVALGVLVARQ